MTKPSFELGRTEEELELVNKHADRLRAELLDAHHICGYLIREALWGLFDDVKEG